MIHTHDDTGARLALTYNGLTLNDPADAFDDTYELNAASVIGQFDQVLESDPSDDGTEVGPVKRSLLVLRLDGTIRAPTIARLKDKVLSLVTAFDPALASYNNTTTNGVLPLTFSVPTADLTNYPSGLAPSIYYARARSAPIPPASSYTGTACFFTVEMIIPKARRFWATASTLTNAGTITNTLAGDSDWPTISFTMGGPGNAATTFTRAHATFGTKTLTLDLSGRSATQAIIIDMGAKSVTVNNVAAPELVVAGSSFWRVDVGSNVITIPITTNMLPITTTWRRAWAV